MAEPTMKEVAELCTYQAQRIPGFVAVGQVQDIYDRLVALERWCKLGNDSRSVGRDGQPTVAGAAYLVLADELARILYGDESVGDSYHHDILTPPTGPRQKRSKP